MVLESLFDGPKTSLAISDDLGASVGRVGDALSKLRAYGKAGRERAVRGGAFYITPKGLLCLESLPSWKAGEKTVVRSLSRIGPCSLRRVWKHSGLPREEVVELLSSLRLRGKAFLKNGKWNCKGDNSWVT